MKKMVKRGIRSITKPDALFLRVKCEFRNYNPYIIINLKKRERC
jgi:hypothetical protein